jgi:Ca2+-binding EF-hand superfamily protein
MSVASIGSTTFNPQAMASQMASSIMKEADTDGNGTLSKTELTAFKASKGGHGPDVDEVFSTYNKSGDGELTQSELQSSIEAEGAKMQAQGGRPGPPPANSAEKSGSSDASATSSSSSTTKANCDVKDLNQDGKVTEAEILMYSLTHPNLDKTEAQTSKMGKLTQDSDSAGGNSLLNITA